MTASLDLPGRLGDPDRTLGTDPRADVRMVAVLEAAGLAGPPERLPLAPEPTIEDIRALVDVSEPGFERLGEALFAGLPPVEGVQRHTETVTGVDGNDISLYIHRPAAADGPRPGVLHVHGGGMVMLGASGAPYRRWRDELAALGLVVVGVEFRNAAGSLGPHPFPAGLNDCTSALEWTHARRAEMGLSKLLVSGESGGANLTLATTLKAREDGRLHMIDGVYAQCPYISGAYASPPPELASLRENDGYFLSSEMMAHLVEAYDPGGENLANALAWPLHARAEDLAGLPPHVISVNELDPLRDEGLACYRKLFRAGVAVNCRTVNGTCHAGDLLFAGAMPEVYAASARDLASFAWAL